jgi:hypothetical protein
MRKILQVILRSVAWLSAGLTASLVVAPAYGAIWSDTQVDFLYGTSFNDNGVFGAPKFAKTIMTLQHASGNSHGRNFFFVDMLKSDSDDGNYGEIYGEYYHSESLTKMGGVDWSKRSLKDIDLTLGINYGSKNSAFGPNPRVYLIGPTFDFNVPGAAFVSVDVLAYMDQGTFSGFGGGDLCGSHKTTFQITPAWKVPFKMGSQNFTFEGFMDVIGSHGDCESQVLTQPQFRWDIGKPGGWSVGFEYQYWHNAFGLKETESFPQFLIGTKF